MRKGNNPTKDLAQVPDPAPHVVVIPLYIPEMDGYYKDALKVFETCLESLMKTKQPTTEICVVANGCCETVTHRLSEYHKKGWIQDLFLLKEGVGKINALLKALRSLETRSHGFLKPLRDMNRFWSHLHYSHSTWSMPMCMN